MGTWVQRSSPTTRPGDIRTDYREPLKQVDHEHGLLEEVTEASFEQRVALAQTPHADIGIAKSRDNLDQAGVNVYVAHVSITRAEASPLMVSPQRRPR